MSQEKNYGTKATFKVLGKIKNLKRFSPENSLLRYKIIWDDKKNKLGIKLIKEDEILFDLKRWGVIKFTSPRELIEDDLVYILQVLPKFDEIYIEHEKSLSSISHPKKLNYYPTDNIATYGTEIYKFTGKGAALLNLVHKNKNTPFNVEDIKKHCNKNLETYKFKKRKDISDTLLRIKTNLKVTKGEYFPIIKQKSSWIWQEK